ncbi:hypothetical protein LNP74_00175 [Klebsiella pneumoniae subsp. pneumoniae]|nr:hypothetical protein [Klebsiella pneumoniae subsp. pneumoniae]
MKPARIPVTLGNILRWQLNPSDQASWRWYAKAEDSEVLLPGVLDNLCAGFNPFDLMLGASAGAKPLRLHVCNQQRLCPQRLSPATPLRQFFDPMRFVRGGNAIDLDWLVEATSQQMPLAMNYAEAQFALGWLCACRGDGLRQLYTMTPQTWLDLIRAPAPSRLYRSGVFARRHVSYLDSGVSDAIRCRKKPAAARPSW